MAHYFDYDDGLMGMYVCVKTYQIMPFKYVKLIACWSYFNEAVRKEYGKQLKSNMVKSNLFIFPKSASIPRPSFNDVII